MRTSKKSIFLLAATTLIFSLLSTSASFSADKIGGPCSKKGATSTISGTPVKCNPNGNKNTWVATGNPGSGGGNSSGDKKQPVSSFDPENPPAFVTANFVDPTKIFLVSKFRSGIGHDFSGGSGETCRSMKHYLATMDDKAPDYKIEGGGKKEAMPIPVKGVDVPIYSPADGTYDLIPGDGIPINREVDVTPTAYATVRIRLMHVAPLDSMKPGQKVKAGQQIGLVLRNQSFDAAIETQVNDKVNKTRYISIFKAMTPSVFAEWKKRGATSPAQFSLTKAQVDAKPWKCETGTGAKAGDANFAVNYLADQATFAISEVPLIGYEDMTAKMKAKYGM